MRRLAIAVCAVVLFGCAPSPVDGDAVLAAHLDADRPGCSAAVGRDGTVAWAGARGLANVATGEELTTASVLDLASVSKQFTATAVLLLAEEGALSLDDSLADWVDGMPADASEISLNDLMHHTSNIADYTDLLDAEFSESTTQQDALDAIAALPRLRGGDGFSYSNSNYVLLAEVVEAASGMPLAEFLDERIFAVLELDMRLEPAYDGPTVAQSYEDGVPLDWGWLQVGDGSIYTTPSELVRWADNYRTGELGGSAVLEAQVAGAVDTGEGTKYGAGIEVAADGSLSHLGGWEGYVTVFGVSADKSTAIAVMCNSTEADAIAIAEGLRALWVP